MIVEGYHELIAFEQEQHFLRFRETLAAIWNSSGNLRRAVDPKKQWPTQKEKEEKERFIAEGKHKYTKEEIEAMENRRLKSTNHRNARINH